MIVISTSVDNALLKRGLLAAESMVDQSVYRVRAAMSAANSLGFGAATSGVGSSMQKLTGLTRGFTQSLNQMTSVLTGGLGIGVAMGALGGLVGLFTKGIAKAQEFQTAQLSIAASLQSAYKVVGGSGKELTGARGFNVVSVMGQQINQEIIRRQAENILTYQEQLKSFQAAVFPGARKGLKARQTLDISEDLAVVAKSGGMAGEQIPQQVRLAMGGGVNVARSQIGRMLGLENTQVKGLQGQDYIDYIKGKIKGFEAAKEPFQNTVETIITSLQTAVDQFAARIGKKFIDKVRPAIESLGTFLGGPGGDKLGDTMAKGFTQLFMGLQKVGESPVIPMLMKFFAFLAEHADTLIRVAAFSALLGVLGRLGGMLGSVTGFFGKMATEAAVAATSINALATASAKLGASGGGTLDRPLMYPTTGSWNERLGVSRDPAGRYRGPDGKFAKNRNFDEWTARRTLGDMQMDDLASTITNDFNNGFDLGDGKHMTMDQAMNAERRAARANKWNKRIGAVSSGIGRGVSGAASGFMMAQMAGMMVPGLEGSPLGGAVNYGLTTGMAVGGMAGPVAGAAAGAAVGTLGYFKTAADIEEKKADQIAADQIEQDKTLPFAARMVAIKDRRRRMMAALTEQGASMAKIRKYTTSYAAEMDAVREENDAALEADAEQGRADDLITKGTQEIGIAGFGMGPGRIRQRLKGEYTKTSGEILKIPGLSMLQRAALTGEARYKMQNEQDMFSGAQESFQAKLQSPFGNVNDQYGEGMRQAKLAAQQAGAQGLIKPEDIKATIDKMQKNFAEVFNLQLKKLQESTEGLAFGAGPETEIAKLEKNISLNALSLKELIQKNGMAVEEANRLLASGAVSIMAQIVKIKGQFADQVAGGMGNTALEQMAGGALNERASTVVGNKAKVAGILGDVLGEMAASSIGDMISNQAVPGYRDAAAKRYSRNRHMKILELQEQQDNFYAEEGQPIINPGYYTASGLQDMKGGRQRRAEEAGINLRNLEGQRAESRYATVPWMQEQAEKVKIQAEKEHMDEVEYQLRKDYKYHPDKYSEKTMLGQARQSLTDQDTLRDNAITAAKQAVDLTAKNKELLDAKARIIKADLDYALSQENMTKSNDAYLKYMTKDKAYGQATAGSKGQNVNNLNIAVTAKVGLTDTDIDKAIPQIIAHLKKACKQAGARG